MPRSLLAITIGPIQEFIAAGRRSRDLWSGSRILSEISRAAANTVKEAGGQTIFPGPETLAHASDDVSIANVILAELPEGVAPETVVEQARLACQKSWRERVSNAKQIADGLLNTKIWEQQKAEPVIEFYAAWTPYESDAAYAKSRGRVMRLLAGRKNLRNFAASTVHGKGIPKSSLDGSGETVLLEKKLRKGLAKRLRLSRGEQLDVVGLTKRADEQNFRSVSRVAAESWLRGIHQHAPEDFKRFRNLCQDLRSQGKLGPVPDDMFPYEGTPVFRTRYRDLAYENEDLEEDSVSLPEPYATLSHAVERLEDLYGRPDPYVVCLMADGDFVGAALSGMKTPKQHRIFSDRLAHFAREVRRVVGENHGSLIYSGGDDVLAFLPVATALRCAAQLRALFHTIVVEEGSATGSSLSVGIAVGHFMEHMEDLRANAAAAEKHAKSGKKNALAIHVYPRGGAPVRVWSSWDDDLPKRIKTWTDAYLKEELSRKSAYDLRAALDSYLNRRGDRDKPAWEQALFVEAFREDAARVLQGKRIEAATAERIGQRLAAINNFQDAETLVNELLVARRFAAAVNQPSRLKGAPSELLLTD